MHGVLGTACQWARLLEGDSSAAVRRGCTRWHGARSRRETCTLPGSPRAVRHCVLSDQPSRIDGNGSPPTNAAGGRVRSIVPLRRVAGVSDGQRHRGVRGRDDGRRMGHMSATGNATEQHGHVGIRSQRKWARRIVWQSVVCSRAQGSVLQRYHCMLFFAGGGGRGSSEPAAGAVLFGDGGRGEHDLGPSWVPRIWRGIGCRWQVQDVRCSSQWAGAR